MIKRIYHGSDHVIKRPEFGRGNRRNDYGLGFYCTEDLDLAREWGVDEGRDGIVNAYDIDIDDLDILDLGDPNLTALHWLSVLVENRTFDTRNPLVAETRDYLRTHLAVDYASRDIIIGWRADDSYFAYAQDFLSGAISVRQLSIAMRLGDLGEQFVIKSQRAFDRLCYVGHEEARCNEWYPRKQLRDQLARQSYLQGERYARQRGDLYITTILDEEVSPDDPRLR